MPNHARVAYTTGQAATAAKLAYHILDHWSKSEIVVPSVCESSGPDTCRAYSFGDVVALAVAKRMREVGFGLSALKEAASYLNTCDYKALCEMTMLAGTGDGHVVAGKADVLVDALRRSSRVSWMVNVGAVVTEVKSALRNVSQPKRGKARRVGCLTASG